MNATRAKILVVDDEPRLRKSLKDLIALHGYRVQSASGGKEAIACLRQEYFDLMLLDLVMPDMGGHEVMEFIRESNLDTIVIVVSGQSSIDAAVGALRRGAYDFVRKPYASEELLKTVDNAVKRKRLEEDNRAMATRLRESERLHRYMVNNSPDIIYMLDHKGRFSFINARIETLLGYTPGELIGQHYSVLIHQEDMELAHYTFNERRTGERASSNVELRLKCKGGSEDPRYFDTNLLPIELSSMGIYSGSSEMARKSFVGTYGVARDITERKLAEETINYQAYHDLLTGLPNRMLFKDRLSLALAQARRNSEMLAVMFIDLDRFKLVNDTLGHVIGDDLLQAVTRRLKGCLREGDTVARVGGDEFMVLLPQISVREDAAQVARNINQELRNGITLDGHEIFATASIGTAVYPQDGADTDTLIKNADIAMYHVKDLGKDGHQFYREDMDVMFCHYLSMEAGMRRGLEDNQFLVFYQPQYDAATGEVVGVEALIRWQHPTRGLLSPAEFIPCAEESGLILAVGEWLLRAACAEMRLWRMAGLPPFRLAVNLSGPQLEHPSIVESIVGILRENDLSGDCLEIEITENIIMKDMDRVVAKLKKLSSHGITIAIDDFGTGYSSLSYLRKLPIHTLKIDRLFVHDITSERRESTIVTAIIAMAKGLGLNVVAEGVENQLQCQRLQSLGCAEMQGFYFSQPLPAEAATQLLTRRRFASSAIKL